MSDGDPSELPAEEIQQPHDCFNRKWWADPEAASDALGVLAPDSLSAQTDVG